MIMFGTPEVYKNYIKISPGILRREQLIKVVFWGHHVRSSQYCTRHPGLLTQPQPALCG